MRKRAPQFMILWACVLIAVSGVYRAVATPAQPEKSAGDSGEPAVVAGAVEQRPQARIVTSRAGLSALAMSETFEGAWPAPNWDLADQSAIDGGTYLWGKRNCHPHSGALAGWSVGGGAQGSNLGCAGQYPNNARSWAVYGPFDLRGVTAARLTFHIWGTTEGGAGCPYDYLFVGSSADGNQFSGDRFCGNWTSGDAGNGYDQFSLDLGDLLGQNQVWIAFLFASDDTITNGGMTIDDLSLDLGETPTNTPTRTTTQTPMPTASPTPTSTATASATTTLPGDPPASTPTSMPIPTDAPTAVPAPPAPAYLPVVIRQIPPTPTATLTPAPDTSLDGNWSGTTGQQVPIFFRVANRTITYLEANYEVSDCSVTVKFYQPIAISGNTFTASSQGDGYSYTIAGTFQSSTRATGTITASESGFCNGNANTTWSARK